VRVLFTFSLRTRRSTAVRGIELTAVSIDFARG